MESSITKEELCEVYLDVMALNQLAKFICENEDEKIDKDFFRVYHMTLNTISKKIEKHLD